VPLGVKGFTSHDGGELVSLEIDIKGAENEVLRVGNEEQF